MVKGRSVGLTGASGTGSAAAQLGDGVGMAALIAGMALRPSRDRATDISGLTGVGLGLESLEQKQPTALLLLTATGPGHEEAVPVGGELGKRGEI